MSTAAPPSEVRFATEPFIMGTPAQFERLREWLVRVGYTEAAICAAANVASVGKLTSLTSGRTIFAKPVDAQSLLVQVFLDSLHIPWETVHAVLSPAELALLTDLGLLLPAVADASKCVGTVALIPSENIHVVSDRLTSMEVIGSGLPPDLVYTPLTAETQRFVELMPRVQCRDYLEMCAGSGIAALLAAKQFAGHAYSADITERSTRFAQFNAALNGLTNVTAVQGDLYEPVAGKMFDVITAHPPYVPSESMEMVYRDGGADGEQITRRIIQGLPDHLRPGGIFYLDCAMTDRAADPLEQRIRRMIGPDEEEFDVLVFRGGMVDAIVYQAKQLAAGRSTPASFARQNEYFQRAGIERLVGVHAIIQRRVSPRPVVTRHHALGDATRAEDLLWLTRYTSETVTWGADETRGLLDARLRALPHTELRTRAVLNHGAWTIVSTMIGTTAPFAVETACPTWFPGLLSQCDGQVTAREHLARMRSEGVVPASTSDDDFAQLIRELADVPFLELDAFPLPGSKTEKTAEKTA